MSLNQIDEANSFNAVRSFLKSINLFRGCTLDVQIVVQSDVGRHSMNDSLEISFYEREAIYTFYSNCFYSYTKTNKIKSSEYLFKWDEVNNELFTFHDNAKIKIKRK